MSIASKVCDCYLEANVSGGKGGKRPLPVKKQLWFVWTLVLPLGNWALLTLCCLVWIVTSPHFCPCFHSLKWAVDKDDSEIKYLWYRALDIPSFIFWQLLCFSAAVYLLFIYFSFSWGQTNIWSFVSLLLPTFYFVLTSVPLLLFLAIEWETRCLSYGD